MATCTCSSKPPMSSSVKCRGEACIPRGPASSSYGYGRPSVVGMGRLGCNCASSWLDMRKTSQFVARGCCGYDRSSSGGDSDEEWEADQEELVKVLLQVKPYLSVHCKKVFVVVLSAEIVESPYLDATLKVLTNSQFSASATLICSLSLTHIHTNLAYLQKILTIHRNSDTISKR